ncbi:channel protein TolC [Agaricicola taiwanensis]|uniref:Channel protein TolC n=2 Tax=Agaricicola taiwanensis TaxID=591372 RepID=A0A8J3DVP2_9RHOB|nr:channel protein TolC [Agaricicola taiwanensis]
MNSSVSAETLEAALARAYAGNQTLNAQRAATRAVDEQVPQALSGYRPQIFGSAAVSAEATEARGGGQSRTITGYPRSVGISLEQNLFDGFRTPNSVRAAEASVLASREALRNTEQNVLFDAVEAYMNVLRDFAIFDLQRNNVDLINEDLRATRERFDVGEVTRTDVAQAEARLASGRSQVSVAEANLKASRAIYRQRIGNDPGKLFPGRAIDRLLPRSIDEAIQIGHAEHPAIMAALYNVDAAQMQAKVIEGELLPTVSIEAGVTNSWNNGGNSGGISTSADRSTAGSITGRVTVPIYQGGGVSSRVRQAKETLGQRRIEADLTREEVRAAIVSAWGALEGARAQIVAAQAQVEAAQIALNGVREESKVGQRTTLDVLNAQQELLNGRVTLITAQRDRVVASYALYQAVGRLSARSLTLAVSEYKPTEHYNQVRDKWFGLRTPDGR